MHGLSDGGPLGGAGTGLDELEKAVQLVAEAVEQLLCGWGGKVWMRVAAVTVGQPDGVLGRRHQDISVVAVPCSLWNQVLAPRVLVDGTAQRVGMVQHVLQVGLDGGAVGEEMLGGCVAVELAAAEGTGPQGPCAVSVDMAT